MKKLTLFTLSLFTLSVTFGQSGARRNLDSFNAVSVQEGIEVYMTKGNTETARIESVNIDLEDVITEISGETLRIHLAGSNHRNVDVKVFLTFKKLEALSASSAASVTIEDEVENSGFKISASSSGSVELNLRANEVEVDVSSSGSVEVKLSASELNAELSSSGDIDIAGEVDYLEVGASSSGDFNGTDFTSKRAEVRASSGASIRLHVVEELDARASSGASVRYKGDPKKVNADSSSGGSVHKF